MSTSRTKIKWEDATFKWEDATGDGYTWDDVVLIQQIVEIAQGDSGDWQTGLSELPEDKKKKLVRLIMRRRGIKMYDEAKEVQNISAQVNDIKLIISEVKKAKVTMEMSHV